MSAIGEMGRTLRYSLVCSCHSLVMVCGAGLANERMVAKIMKLTARPMATPMATFFPSSGGSRARGPCGPKETQYAVRESFVSVYLRIKCRFNVAPSISIDDWLFEPIDSDKTLRDWEVSRIQ